MLQSIAEETKAMADAALASFVIIQARLHRLRGERAPLMLDVGVHIGLIIFFFAGGAQAQQAACRVLEARRPERAHAGL